MKIDYLSSEGIHQAEKEANEKMRTTFNASPFSQHWQGFAGFEMIDKVHRDREIDVILITHDRLRAQALRRPPASSVGSTITRVFI